MKKLYVLQTWVKSSNGTSTDEQFYVSSVRELLASTSDAEFSTRHAEFRERWSSSFVEYFEHHLLAAVSVSAEFATRDAGIMTVPYVGVTNNVSESYNRVLKDFQHWKVNIHLQLCYVYD